MLANWQKWCRLCGKCDADDIIVEYVAYENISFAIQKYFSITLLGPIKSICPGCCDYVIKLEKFAAKCSKVDELFKTLLSSGENVQFDENYLQSLRYQIDLDKEEKTALKENKATDTEDLIGIDASPISIDGNRSSYDRAVERRQTRIKKEPKAKRSGRKPRLKVEKEEIKEEEEMEIETLDYDDDDYENDPSFDMTSDDQENKMLDEDECDDDEYLGDELIVPNEIGDKPRRHSRKRAQPEISESKSFKCPLCEIDFENKRRYDTHMRENHPKSENPFACSKCPKRFPSFSKLQRHDVVHLPDELKLIHQCEFCDKKFSKLVNVQAHIRAIHTRDRPFICEECGKSFVANGALKEHQVTHSNEYPFQCPYCPKKFKNLARLRTHEDIHKHTAYICPHCGLQLNTKRTLKMHMVVHSDQKKYKCQYCGNEYKRSKALKNHLILHTGLRPYTCPFCEKTFANGSNCRSHKKKSHPVELAALEASGELMPQANIPKLEHLQPKKPSTTSDNNILIITQSTPENNIVIDNTIVQSIEYNIS